MDIKGRKEKRKEMEGGREGKKPSALAGVALWMERRPVD